VKTILKVLVGSKAHGLSNESSDKDYRAVFIYPTQAFLDLNGNPPLTSWIEGEEDNTAYELKKFLADAINGLPNTIEMFFAPIVEITPEGQELLDLFPYVWDKQKVYDAFTGYAENNLKKMLENKDGRENKYAGFIIRILYNLICLLRDGNLDVTLKDNDYTKIVLMDYKKADHKLDHGLVVNRMRQMIVQAKELLSNCKQQPNYRKIDEFLIKIRKENL